MEKRAGRLIGQLRLTRPTPCPVGGVVVQGVDVQACGVVVVGDGTGVPLPALDTTAAQRMRHAPGLYHRRTVVLAAQMEAIEREVSQVRRLKRVSVERAQRRVAQAHGYGTWADLIQAANP